MQMITIFSEHDARVLTFYQEMHENPARCGDSKTDVRGPYHRGLTAIAAEDHVMWLCPDCDWSEQASTTDFAVAYDWLVRKVGQDGLDAFLQQG
jgi:hypothetical protein